MKYGNFIGQKHLPMSAEEVKAFENAIYKEFKHSILKISKVENITTHENTGFVINDAAQMDIRCNFHLCLKNDSVIIGRNKYGDRLKFQELIITITKKEGYLEANHQPTKSFIESYDMWISFPNSKFIEYGCRDLSPIYLRQGKDFDYGTKVEDFNFWFLNAEISRLLDMKRSTRKELEKIATSFMA
jgi:hypothetical protein